MKTCPQCGADVVDGAVFCHKCGTTMTSSENPAARVSGERSAASTADAPNASRSVESAAPAATAADRFRAAAKARQANDDPDQEIELWEGDYSAKAMTGTWILLGLLTLTVLIVAGVFFSMSGTAWLVTAGVLVVLWLGTFLLLLYKQFSVHYRLTNQRLIHQKGLLSRITDRIEVIDMDDITYSQGIIERMLDVGTIKVTSSDRTHPEIDLPGIDNVRHVATLMDDARRQERRRRGLHIEAV